MSADIFISYAREDIATANAISDAFAHLGIRCFLDEENIPFGADWLATLNNAISECSAVLCIISDYESEYVKNEIVCARDYKKPLFAVFLTRSKLRKELDLLTNTSQHLYVDISLQAALPKIFAGLLPWVDRTKHPGAYNAYTEYGPMIHEADVRRRTKPEHRLKIDLAKDDIGKPYPELGKGSIENGKYIFTSYEHSPVTHPIAALPVVTEFVLEARLRRTGGPALDHEWFGIEYGCKGHPLGHCYQFLINGRRELRVAKWVGGKDWKNPIPADKARRFPSGTPEILKIVRNDWNFHVFVNKQIVASLVDPDVRSGRMGPALGPGLTVEFSDMCIDAIV